MPDTIVDAPFYLYARACGSARASTRRVSPRGSARASTRAYSSASVAESSGSVEIRHVAKSYTR